MRRAVDRAAGGSRWQDEPGARLTSSEQTNRLLLRARDAIERPLDIAALSRIALCSEAHFIRSFRRVSASSFGQAGPAGAP